MRVIFAVLLIALSFTGSSNANIPKKFIIETTPLKTNKKWQSLGVSFNGDIKPEQFNFSDVTIKTSGNAKRVNIKAIFQDISTPYKSTDNENTFTITFEGDPKSEILYAIKLGYRTFFQTIPKKFNFEGRENRHLISTRSVEDGSFNALYEQLSDDNKVKIKGACHYFMDDKNNKRITSLKSQLGKNIVGKSTKSVNKLIPATNISEQIKALATLCYDSTNRVYVKDVQTFLNVAGHDVGKNDGLWGAKSQKGWEAYLTSQGKPLDTAINTASVQELQNSISSKIPKLREVTFKDDYFDTKHEIRNHKEPNYGNLCKFIGCPAMLKKKNQIRKVIKDKGNKPFQNSKYIKAITKEQWNTIKDIGDPQNCYERLSTLDKIKTGAVINQKIYAQNKNSIRQSLNKNRVVFLNNGVFQLDKTINLDGKILIGSEKTILDASLLDLGIRVNNSALKNVRVINAKKVGIEIIKNSTLHNVIIENTGVKSKINFEGHGISIMGKNSIDNCLVSVEAFNGFNKTGENSVTRDGGNADGFEIKFGANRITLIDTHGHHNSDDGFDLFKSGHDAPVSKDDIIIRIYYSSAVSNGKNPLTRNGDGNGFKLGSSDKYHAPKKDYGARLIYGSAACFNKKNGFDRNGTKMKIFASKLQEAGNRTNTNPINQNNMQMPKDPYAIKCNMFPR